MLDYYSSTVPYIGSEAVLEVPKSLVWTRLGINKNIKNTTKYAQDQRWEENF